MSRKKAILMATIDPWSLAWKEMSDLGNAERLVARATGMLVHVREWGWLAYDGQRWSTGDGERLAHLKAHEVARGMRDEIEALAAMDDKDLPSWCSTDMRQDRVVALRKHAILSGNASKTKAMLEQAAQLDDLNRRMDDFDVDLLTMNAANRTLRFVEGDAGWEMRDSPHDPADHITRVMACDWNPEATCEAWDEHMATVLPDEEVRTYFQKVIGYCATGLTIEQLFIMLQGKGGDGKSTTMNVIRMIMGGYAVVGNVLTFLAGGQRTAGDTTPELIRFVGDTRLVSLQEPKRGTAIAEERVKQFTGGSPVTGRANYGDEFEFDPRGKVIMEVNSRPRISGDDDGIWRRIVIILFPRQFKGSTRDKSMTQRLYAEKEGVLNWILAGVLSYLRDGLEAPPAVLDAIEEYRRSANPFSEWMAARVVLTDPLALSLSSDLYADYKSWCEEEGIGDREVLNSTAFGRALGDRQIMLGPKHRTGKKQRRGARLRLASDLATTGEPDAPPKRTPSPAAPPVASAGDGDDDDIPI